MLKVLSNILCDLDPKVKVIGQKAGICDGVPSTSALVLHITPLCCFIAYTFKGQVHVFAGRVKIVSHWSCRTSAILKYFYPSIYDAFFNVRIFQFTQHSRCLLDSALSAETFLSVWNYTNNSDNQLGGPHDVYAVSIVSGVSKSFFLVAKLKPLLAKTKIEGINSVPRAVINALFLSTQFSEHCIYDRIFKREIGKI